MQQHHPGPQADDMVERNNAAVPDEETAPVTSLVPVASSLASRPAQPVSMLKTPNTSVPDDQTHSGCSITNTKNQHQCLHGFVGTPG